LKGRVVKGFFRPCIIMRGIRRVMVLCVITGLMILLYSHEVFSVDELKVFSLYQGESIVIDVPGLQRAAIGSDEIADFRVLNAAEILLNAIKPGKTSLIIWRNDIRELYQVEVKEHVSLDSYDQRVLCNRIHESIGEAGVNVRFVEGTVLLEGIVRTEEDAERAFAIANLYADKVKNFIKVNTTRERIRFQVQIIEILRDASSRLGFSSIDSIVTQGILKNTEAIFDSLSLTVAEGNAKVLSQPSLVVFEEETAELLVGGEVPVPVFQGDSISVEWKKYGVSMNISAVVEADGAITVDFETEVSTLDWSNGVEVGGNKIPAFRVRRETTRVKTYQNDVLVLGGLIQFDELEQVQKLPVIGDIPIIGELFTHRLVTEKQTELVILVKAEVI
jgi:pilus assembly protein CpaC